MLTLYHYIWCW